MMAMKSFILLAACTFIYLAVAVPRGLGGRRWANGLYFGSEDTKVMDLSELQIEHIWSNCMLDLLGTKSVMSASDLIIIDIILYLSTENLWEDMQEILPQLPPDLQRSLIDCLTRQNLLNFFRDSSLINRYATLFTRIIKQDSLSRRRLEGPPVRKTSPSTDRSSTPILRLRPQIQPLSTAPVPAPLLVLPPAPSPNIELPDPSLPPIELPLPEDDPEDPSQSLSPDDLPEPEFVDPTPDLSAVPPKQRSDSVKKIIIAVVVTATTTFTLAAFCFCCCNRYAGSKYHTVNGQKEERPILSLSLSDFSGSSQNSFGLYKDKFGLSFKTDPNQSGQLKSFATTAEGHIIASSSSELTNNAARNPSPPPAPPPPPLKLPPGKTSTAPPAPPPLPKPKPAPPPPRKPPPSKGVPFPSKASLSSSANSQLKQSDSSMVNVDTDAAKTKLKPFFWDKVMANPDQSMVWHQIKAGSFQFNEEMIEMLFGYNAADKSRNDTKKDFRNDSLGQHIQILDQKKSQNLAISLKAQNVKVEEVCNALKEGKELPIELLQTLLRMAPTSDEELKLRLFNDDSVFLGPAEQFLKAMVNIPFAFKRIDALLFMASLQEESSSVKESFAILEKACNDLRNSRLFLKLLEAVLKTGNRMNDGTYRGGAKAFKLDTLLKLLDVKGADGKTTLLHFVAQEIIRSEGRRAMQAARDSRCDSTVTIRSFNSDDFNDDIPDESEDRCRELGLRAVSSLSYELENVRKAAGLDADALTSAVVSLGNRLVKTREFLNTDMSNLEEKTGFQDSFKGFIEHAEADIAQLLEEEKRIRSLVKHTTDFFHGNVGRDEGLRLFVTVRDFLEMLDNVCKEVREAQKKVMNKTRSKDNSISKSISNPRPSLFPAIKDRRMEDFSSEDEEF